MISQHLVACDVFTVETAWLQILYVFFFRELGSRRVQFAGGPEPPTAEGVTQPARQRTGPLPDEQRPSRFLIRDRAAQYTANFDTVFAAENVEIMRTPYRAPRAKAFAERWMRTAREESLDRVLILKATHLRRVLIE